MEKRLHIVIQPSKKWKPVNFSEIFRFKDLLYFMVLRDITVIYKQTILGFLWAIINPLVSTVIFSVVFGKLAQIPSDGIPYPIFSYCALIPWTYFSQTLSGCSNSLISQSSTFTKVYYPRIFIPLTPAISKLVDFFISLICIVFFLIYFRIPPNLNLLLLPLLIVIMILSASGIGMWLSALTIQYRDVKFVMTFFIQILMFAAPVVFPASLLLNKFGETAFVLYGLYPMVGVIEGFRSAFAGTPIPWLLILSGAISSIILFSCGLFYFRKMERTFADIV